MISFSEWIAVELALLNADPPHPCRPLSSRDVLDALPYHLPSHPNCRCVLRPIKEGDTW